ncbi:MULTISPECIES: hypothetical protein [Candidatus Nitrosocaldus]|jgi:hypothetical protein|uniref:SMODS-associated and fused to various effectors domain-containing protein n=1 Tax=Candidatus Nitrosocaldus cavascurensis TaxID=2058097 RepID=A0A2K5ASI4_9ARCH|nr:MULTISPECIES: hypothetical protein [Candidatus Nitrosocaldus]SPC34597.1 protein of unknown function [Candidatus Nitrosocaldus cavascurensis]
MAKIIVIEIGKSVVGAVIKHLGRPYAVVSYPREVHINEFKKIVKEAYQKINDALSSNEYSSEGNSSDSDNEVWLILSGPLALIFQLGQVVGEMDNVKILQYYNGEYHIVPSISKDELSK